jgi:hypothetical protein
MAGEEKIHEPLSSPLLRSKEDQPIPCQNLCFWQTFGQFVANLQQTHIFKGIFWGANCCCTFAATRELLAKNLGKLVVNILLFAANMLQTQYEYAKLDQVFGCCVLTLKCCIYIKQVT